MPEASIFSARTPERIVFLSRETKDRIFAKFGLRVEQLDENDVKKHKLAELMAKAKKPLDFVISFDGAWFRLGIKVGSWKYIYKSINLVEDKSIKDKQKVLKSLITFGVATQKQLDELNERNELD